MKRPVMVAAIGCVVFLASAAALAGGRPDKSYKDWFGHFAAGYSVASGDIGDIIDDDFYVNGGATYWPENWAAGIDLDLSWAEYDISSSAIRAINDAIASDPGNSGSVTGGDVTDWSFSVNAIWGPNTGGSVGFYVIGGVGVDYLEGQITDNGLVYYPPICSPWYWWCVPGGVGPGTFIVGKTDSWEFAWNAGLGVDFELGSGSTVYLEAKYHVVETDRASSELIPLVFGIRW